MKGGTSRLESDRQEDIEAEEQRKSEKSEGMSKDESDELFERTLKAIEIITGKTREEAIAEAIKDLSSDPKVEYYSDLDKREVPSLAVMRVIARRYDVEWLDDWISTQLRLRVSHRRKGRIELVKTIVGHRKSLEERVRGIFRREKEGESE